MLRSTFAGAQKNVLSRHNARLLACGKIRSGLVLSVHVPGDTPARVICADSVCCASCMSRLNPLVNICVVGNVASGKSSLTELLAAEIPNSAAILERFDHNPFLPLNFLDPPRWAFTNAVRYFYDYALEFFNQTRGQAYAHHFIDAGAATNRHVYGLHMLEQAVVTQAEYDFYETLCDLIQRAFEYPEPDAYIFVQASPELCFERMQARMRARKWEYQHPISVEYLAGLEIYFERFRARLAARSAPLLTIESRAFDFHSPEGRAAVVARVQGFLDEV